MEETDGMAMIQIPFTFDSKKILYCSVLPLNGARFDIKWTNAAINVSCDTSHDIWSVSIKLYFVAHTNIRS